MAIKIDSLELDVKTNASSAAGQVNKLAESLRNLKPSAKGSKNEVDKLSKTFKSLKHSGIGNLFSSVGRIAFYRAIRSGIKAITTAVKEGTSNLYQYGKAFNSAFVQSMDSMATSFQYLKNGLAVGVAPIIQALTPAIVSAADALADFGNKISEAYAAKNGEKYFTKAVKSFKEYQEAVEAAKSTTLGFDELNVINKDKSLDGMFEQAAVDTERVKDNSWGIAGILAGIAAIGVGNGALKAVLELSQAGLLTQTTASLIELSGALGIAAGAFTLFATKGNDMKTWLNDVMDKINQATASATDKIPILKGFAYSVIQILEFPFKQLGIFSDMIYDLFHGDWAGLGEGALNMLLNTANVLVSVLNGMLYASAGLIQKIINVGISGINTVIQGLDEALSKIGIDWFNGVKIPELDFVSGWTVPQASFSVEDGIQIDQIPLGSKAGQVSGDNILAAGANAGLNLAQQIAAQLAEGTMNGVPGELQDSTGLSGQQINLYLDGKQIYGAVRKAEVMTGRSIAFGVAY